MVKRGKRQGQKQASVAADQIGSCFFAARRRRALTRPPRRSCGRRSVWPSTYADCHSMVCDIRDELGRVAAPRPFAFLPTIDPRAYSSRLATLTRKPIATYKCVTDLTEAGRESRLMETRRDYGFNHLSLVGRPSPRDMSSTTPLLQAVELVAAHPAHFTVGGVAIAERHGTSPSESLRMLKKATAGCSFFI